MVSLRYAVLYSAATTGSPVDIISSGDGNSWTGPATAPTTATITVSSAVAVGNTVHFATVISSGEVYWNCAYPCSRTSPVLTLAPDPSGGANHDDIVLSTNSRSGGDAITATYHIASQVFSRTSDDNGKSWTPPQQVSDPSTTSRIGDSLQADYDYVQGTAIVATTDVAWIMGTSQPYSIAFPAYPVVVPSAASTSNPWATSGYSPYESYFSQLNVVRLPGKRVARGESDRPRPPRQEPAPLGDQGL